MLIIDLRRNTVVVIITCPYFLLLHTMISQIVPDGVYRIENFAPRSGRAVYLAAPFWPSTEHVTMSMLRRPERMRSRQVLDMYAYRPPDDVKKSGK
jgi:hypothetical protein